MRGDLERVDYLNGFKENVIMGHLIPAGTGFPMYRNIKRVPLAEPLSPSVCSRASICWGVGRSSCIRLL